MKIKQQSRARGLRGAAAAAAVGERRAGRRAGVGVSVGPGSPGEPRFVPLRTQPAEVDPHTNKHRCKPTATVSELEEGARGRRGAARDREQGGGGQTPGLPCRRSASTARARSGYPGATARRTAPPSSSSSAKVRPLLLTPPAPLPAASDRARAAQGRTPRRRRAARAWRLGSCCRR